MASEEGGKKDLELQPIPLDFREIPAPRPPCKDDGAQKNVREADVDREGPDQEDSDQGGALPTYFLWMLVVCGALPYTFPKGKAPTSPAIAVQRALRVMFIAHGFLNALGTITDTFFVRRWPSDEDANVRVGIIFSLAHSAYAVGLPCLYWGLFRSFSDEGWQNQYESASGGLKWVTFVHWSDVTKDSKASDKSRANASDRDQTLVGGDLDGSGADLETCDSATVPFGRKSVHSAKAYQRRRTNSGVVASKGTDASGVRVQVRSCSAEDTTAPPPAQLCWAHKLRKDVREEWLEAPVPMLNTAIEKECKNLIGRSWLVVLVILVLAGLVVVAGIPGGFVRNWLRSDEVCWDVVPTIVCQLLDTILLTPHVMSPLPVACGVMLIKYCTDLHSMEAQLFVLRMMITSKWFREAADRFKASRTGQRSGGGAIGEKSADYEVSADDEEKAAEEEKTEEAGTDEVETDEAVTVSKNPDRVLTRYIRVYEGMRRRRDVTCSLWSAPAMLLFGTSALVAIFGTYISVRLSISGKPLDTSVLIWTFVAIAVLQASLSGIVAANARFAEIVPHIHLSRCFTGSDARSALQEYMLANEIRLSIAGFRIESDTIAKVIYPLFTIFIATALEALKENLGVD